jgi:hypothetical protein
MRRSIIAFTGPIGSGKTTAAMQLEKEWYQRVRFAETLKRMAIAFGLTREQVDGAYKEVPAEIICGKTPRFFMQSLGTEWGRSMLGEEVWVNAWRATIERLSPSTHVVVDDARFPNEFEMVRRLGGLVVYIDREGCEPGEHPSEQFDCEPDYIINNTDLLKFRKEVSAIGDLRREMCERYGA